MNIEMTTNDDNLLSYSEKLELVAAIENMQMERWKRIRFWRKQTIFDLNTKHMFLRNEIHLIRSQAKRLQELKSSVEN